MRIYSFTQVVRRVNMRKRLMYGMLVIFLVSPNFMLAQAAAQVRPAGECNVRIAVGTGIAVGEPVKQCGQVTENERAGIIATATTVAEEDCNSTFR
jgi:hypothetical protein